MLGNLKEEKSHVKVCPNISLAYEYWNYVESSL
jgi:hypothetical protein